MKLNVTHSVHIHIPVRGSSRLVVAYLTGEKQSDILLTGILTVLKLLIMNIKNKKLLVIGIIILLIIVFSILNTLG